MANRATERGAHGPPFSSAAESWTWCAPGAGAASFLGFRCEPDERGVIWWICVAFIGQFVVALLILVFGKVSAPYGRYNQASETNRMGFAMRMLSKCNVPAKAAWIIQECPTLIAAVVCCLDASSECLTSWGNRLALGCFTAHYVNRTVVYPCLLKGSKPTPLTVMLMAFAFCAFNGYIQCRSLTRHLVLGGPEFDLCSYVGGGIWLVGLLINIDSDKRLRNLRKPGETGYKIPHGGMFEFVSGANFFGEIVEWIGYAVIMRGAMPGVTFAFCTACNIGPRALAHHEWYKEKFDDYPKNRAALIPLWPWK